MLKVDSIEKINGLINYYTKDYKRVEKILSSFPIKSDDQAFILEMYLMAFVLKKYVSEKDYGKIVVNIYEAKDIDNKSNSLGGYCGKIDGKHTIKVYPLDRECLASEKIELFAQTFATFAHEIYHMKQKIDIDDEKFDYLTIVSCLEFLLKDNVLGFYKTNYQDLVFEITAEAYGNILASDFLKQYKKDFDKDRFTKVVLKMTRPNYEGLLGKDRKIEYLSRLIDLVKKYNIINPSTLDKYPLLKHIFSEDGKFQTIDYFQSLNDEFNYRLKTSGLPESSKEEIMDVVEVLLEVAKKLQKQKTI